MYLKPCPFCGSSDIQCIRLGNPRRSAQIQCNNCGCFLESNDQGINSGDSWNNRHFKAGDEERSYWRRMRYWLDKNKGQ